MGILLPIFMSHPEVFPEKKERPIRVKRVGFDLDDTFFLIAKPSLETLNKKFGTNFTIEDIKEFWYMPAFLRELGKTRKEIESFRDEVYRSLDDRHRVYRNSPPVAGAIEVINGIYRFGHQPFVLTSRPPGLEEIAELQFRAVGIDWIRGDWAEGGNILIRDTEYWERLSSEEFKLLAIKGGFTFGKYKDFPGLDAHLDDMGELLHHPLMDKFPKIKNKIFILAQKHNINITPKENLVNNWWVFYKVVRCLERDEDLDWLTSHNIDNELVEV